MSLRPIRLHARARLGALLVMSCFSHLSVPAADTNVALLDSLIRKGLITKEEAKRVTTHADAMPSVTATNKAPPIKPQRAVERPKNSADPEPTQQTPDSAGKDRTNRNIPHPGANTCYQIPQLDLSWKL